MAGRYEVDYNDKRLTDVRSEQAQKEAEIVQRYDDRINETDQHYNNLIDNSKKWAETQTNLQNQQTEQNISEINQQKEQTEQDYIKEQKGSYADYQKQSNAYGVKAEQIAANGLSNSGYSETSLVNMYNTYQNRVASARDSLNKAVLNFNNSINQAKLANNVKLAEIAEKAADDQMNLALQRFQYKNTLMSEKETQISNNTDRYNQMYNNTLAQINQEIENRKWEDEQAESRRRFEIENARAREEIAMKKKELEATLRKINAEIDNLRASAAKTRTSTTNSGNTSFSFNSSGNKSNSNYNTVLGQARLSSKAPLLGKSAARNTVYNAVNNNQISREEANQIFRTLGL